MLSLALLLCLLPATHGRNRIFSPQVKSLVTVVNDDWRSMPVMQLSSEDVLNVGFDELSHTYHRYVYRIEHCEADWTPTTALFESDWLEGFNDIPVEDYQNSINTTVLYTHYQFQLPNDRCRLKMSGNYLITVYDEDQDNERVMEIQLMVVEPLVTVGLDVTTNTDIDTNKSHQQVSMTVNYQNLSVTNLEEQLQTVVMQNWRTDNARWNVRPNYINTRGLGWEHNRSLIFDAGNEYHKFEVLDVSHPTMGVESIDWDGHHYQVYPFVSIPRRNYLTDVDADGAFYIRNSDFSESEYTCDYVFVHYRLLSPYMGEVYLDAHWTTDDNRACYLMEYDEAQQGYHAVVMQKQGYYSYQYLLADGSIPDSEGSFYETENRYQAFIYYKGTGERTWRLVGYRGVEVR